MNTNREHMDIIIIQGITVDGRKFRPSDWAERMSGMMSRFGDDHRIYYSPRLRPVSIEGVKCIALDASLQQTDPGIYQQIMEFAERNHLIIKGGAED